MLKFSAKTQSIFLSDLSRRSNDLFTGFRLNLFAELAERVEEIVEKVRGRTLNIRVFVALFCVSCKLPKQVVEVCLRLVMFHHKRLCTNIVCIKSFFFFRQNFLTLPNSNKIF